MNNDSADNLIGKAMAKSLPSMPEICAKLLREFCHDARDLDQLCAIVKNDISLSANIFRLANSIEAGRIQKISTLNQAAKSLGFDVVETIAVHSSAERFFSRRSEADSVCFMKKTWWRAINCAFMAERLAKCIEYPVPEEAYLAGLIHDIGQLIFWIDSPEEYERMVSAASDLTALSSMEKKRYGISHQEIGAKLIDINHRHSFLGDAILYHHESVDKILDAHPLVKIVNAADRLIRLSKADLSHFNLDLEKGILPVEQADITAFLKETQQQAERVAISFGIDIDDIVPISRVGNSDIVPEQLGTELYAVLLSDHLRRKLGKTRDELEILKIIKEEARALLGNDRCVFFLWETDKNILNGKSISEYDTFVEELRIEPRRGGSLVADALLVEKPVCSLERETVDILAVVDRQLIRSLKSDGICCLPMLIGDRKIGSIVLGVDSVWWKATENSKGLAFCFAKAAASAIDGARSLMEKELSIDAQEQLLLRTQIKGLLHEIRNPLSVIKNYLGIVNLKMDEYPSVQKELKIINEEIDRVNELLDSLSELSRSGAKSGVTDQGGRTAGLVDVNKTIVDLVRIFRESLPANRNIEFYLDLDESIPLLFVRSGALKQVLMNLIKNAIEAMSGPNKISIESRDKVNWNGTLCIEITVEDHGPGIPSQILAKLFEPVASTKGGGHSGIGLAVVRDLVNTMNGTINCRTFSGRGTTFHILIPRIVASEQVAAGVTEDA